MYKRFINFNNSQTNSEHTFEDQEGYRKFTKNGLPNAQIVFWTTFV